MTISSFNRSKYITIIVYYHILNFSTLTAATAAGTAAAGRRMVTKFGFEKYLYSVYEIEFKPDDVIWFVRANMNLMYMIVFLYFVFVQLGKRVMQSRRPFYGAAFNNTLFCWNLFLTVFSIYGASRVVPYVILSVIYDDNDDAPLESWILYKISSLSCRNTFAIHNGPASLWICLFVFSKVIELIDTVFLVLKKKEVPFLHFFHHLTVLPWAWIELSRESAPSATFAAMNLSVHSVMYCYFAIMSTETGRNHILPPTEQCGIRISMFITFIQCSQMFCGILLLLLAFFVKLSSSSTCNISYESILVSFVVYASYLALFLDFANNKYGIVLRFKMWILSSSSLSAWINNLTKKKVSKSKNKGSYSRVANIENGSSNIAQNNNPKWPWRDTQISLEDRYKMASKLVVMLTHLVEEEEGMQIYGTFKRVQELTTLATNAKATLKNVVEDMDEKSQKKYRAQEQCKSLTLDEAMQKYIDTLDDVAQRSDQKSIEAAEQKQKKRGKIMGSCVTEKKSDSINDDDDYPSVLYDATILGYGKAIPSHCVTNEMVEKRGNFPPGTVDKTRCGVKTRYEAKPENGEDQIKLACKAIRAAVKSANISLQHDVDCIIHCSGIPAQGIPDDACLIQRELGLGESGTPSFTIHASCLSFVVALDIAAGMIHHGRHRTIILTAAFANFTNGIDPKDLHTGPLFGDAAAAIVLSSKSFAETINSHASTGAIHHYSFETYGVGVDCCTVRGAGSLGPMRDNCQFRMRGQDTLRLIGKYIRSCASRTANGLDRGLTNLTLIQDENKAGNKKFDIDWVVPHQASQLALDSLSMMGWEDEKVLKVISKYGNNVGASIPLCLVESIQEGKIKRGQKVLLVGTSAGISFGGMILTF